VVTIKTEPVQLTAVLPGRTTPYAVSDVRPQVGGLLKARLFTEGALVKQGQPLYQIDPAPYQAAYNNAAAVLTAAYKQAQANAQTARINLGYTRITAPISGRIGRSSVTPGALLTADQTTALATIQTLDPIYVDITQSASEVLALKLAMQHGSVNREPADAPATLTLDNGTQYSEQGKLQFAEVSVDQTTGSVSLRALFPNPHGLLLPGMFVRATINEGVDNKAILAPQQGVGHNEKGNPTALVVDAHNMARLRILKTSRAIGDKWLVTDGLKPGDRLIVEGTQNAQPDTPVTPAPASFLKSAKGG
jgi:membrane fusion protein (multidrug efflux system)